MLCRRFRTCKSLAGLFSQSTKYKFRAFSSATISDDESEHFKAAVLHPDKKSLVIETMVNRTKLDDGMVNIRAKISIYQLPITIDFNCRCSYE